jgi:hypothetical protein
MKQPSSSVIRRRWRKPQRYIEWLFLEYTERLCGVGLQREVFPS